MHCFVFFHIFNIEILEKLNKTREILVKKITLGKKKIQKFPNFLVKKG
jgi:ABC-type transport system involved in Fe-S cluster assembly fused permease/ATPase subunit